MSDRVTVAGGCWMSSIKTIKWSCLIIEKKIINNFVYELKDLIINKKSGNINNFVYKEKQNNNESKNENDNNVDLVFIFTSLTINHNNASNDFILISTILSIENIICYVLCWIKFFYQMVLFMDGFWGFFWFNVSMLTYFSHSHHIFFYFGRNFVQIF